MCKSYRRSVGENLTCGDGKGRGSGGSYRAAARRTKLTSSSRLSSLSSSTSRHHCCSKSSCRSSSSMFSSSIREVWNNSSSRLQLTAAAHCSSSRLQPAAASQCSIRHQTQLEGATADSVATSIAAETREQPQQQQLVTPRETRASKKRKAELSPTATPSTPGGILQMDGASDNTPTRRLLPPLDGANGGLTTTPSRPMAPYHAPPKPPPWSTHLPKHPCKVICYLCCTDSHYVYTL